MLHGNEVAMIGNHDSQQINMIQTALQLYDAGIWDRSDLAGYIGSDFMDAA